MYGWSRRNENCLNVWALESYSIEINDSLGESRTTNCRNQHFQIETVRPVCELLEEMIELQFPKALHILRHAPRNLLLQRQNAWLEMYKAACQGMFANREQILSKANVGKRLYWCKNIHTWTLEHWNDVIFSEAFSVTIFRLPSGCICGKYCVDLQGQYVFARINTQWY